MTQPPIKKPRSKLVIILGIVGIMVCLCVVGIIGIGTFAPSTSTPIAQQQESDIISKPTQPDNSENIPTIINTPHPTNTPIPTNTPKPKPLGESRENPAPFGSSVVVDGISMVVEETERPADKSIKEANMFNSDPEPGDEYIMVKVTLSCTKQSNEQCHFYAYDYKVVGSSGIVRENEIFIAGVPHMLESTDFFGGAMLSGWLVFEIGKEETNLVLSYEPMLSFDNGFLELPEKTQ